MFIESLKVSYPSEGWTLEETRFDRLNLLVGASGVGKTRILEAILDLARLATKGDLEESWNKWVTFEWEVRFKIEVSSVVYVWKGRLAESQKSRSKRNFVIVDEQVTKDLEVLIKREKEDVFLNGEKTLKLPAFESLIHILREEPLVQPLFESFALIFESDYLDISGQPYYEGGVELEKYASLDSIRNSSEDLEVRIWWAFKNQEVCSVFREIGDTFLEIFPNFNHFEMSEFSFESEGRKYSDIRFEISEPGLEIYLGYGDLSSGMRKTLDLLCQLYLLPDNSLILIDEFENSLGVNCIDLVAEAVENAGRGLQFIITSHHPYIINRIGAKYWKIVTRKGGIVSTHTAEEFGIGRSRHENFTQLTQLEAFHTGVMPE